MEKIKNLTIGQLVNNIVELYEDMENNPGTPLLLNGKYITSKPYMLKSVTDTMAKDIMNAVYKKLQQKKKQKENEMLISIQLELKYLIEGQTKVISKDLRHYLENTVLPNIEKEVK